MPTFGYSYGYYDYYDYVYDYYSTYLIVYAIIGLIVAIVFGCITKKINENKGYDGGFAWGFWLGVIGIIVVSCRAPAEDVFDSYSYSNNPLPRAQGTLPPGGWYCTGCGRQHAAYVTSCVCGKKKTTPGTVSHTPAAPAAPARPTPYKPTVTAAPAAPKPRMNEADVIHTLKEYKELLDSGVITHEEFEQKKRDLLGQ